MVLLLIVFLAVMLLLNWWGKRSQLRQQEERDKRMSEQLKPGVWVYTAVGFYGRFVDLDGDVLILETPGGVETYWNKAVLRSVSEPPFELMDSEADETSLTDEAEFPGDSKEDSAK